MRPELWTVYTGPDGGAAVKVDLRGNAWCGPPSSTRTTEPMKITACYLGMWCVGLLPVLCGAPLLAQQYHFDFEGPNGLNGWVQDNGQPIALGPGASGANALALAVDPLNPVRRVYYPIPFNSALAYRYSSWMKASDTDVNQRVWLDWVHLNDGSAYGSNAYYTIGGNTGWRPQAVPPHVLPPVDHSADPNAEFCIVLEVSANGTSSAWFDDVMVETSPLATTAFLWVRLLLGGPYSNGYMPANLRLQNLLPTLEPYTALGYAQAGGGGGEVAPTAWWSFNNLDGPVDWVRVELRSAMDPTVVVATRQGLVSQMGSVYGADGTSAIAFNVAPGNYYVAVRHRNHLGCMTATPVALSAPVATPSAHTGVDFTAAATNTWGVNARKVGDTLYNYRVLWPGDTNGNGTIKYAGAGNDRDPLLVAIGGGVPTGTLPSVYNPNDVNLDGTVKYAGSFNDRDPILTSVGGVVPTATRAAQLP
ncbi:MAG: hypothetical protein IPL77_16410 [Flavobacteriales bacterium]|nr:hypothetical protein [Flavobacteriales bacterium]